MQPFYSEQFQAPHFFHLNITTSKVQSCKGWVQEARVPCRRWTSVNQLATPDVWHDKQMPTEGKWIKFHVCTMLNKEMRTRFKCSQCNTQFCVHVSSRKINYTSEDCPKLNWK